ncbi:hypothetical protein ACIGXM_17425 [Kitasatospora sp. NPDC052896]|uniref:hypothetical protein n=1 Tax=Kitasatospora sp. NPDC052896 TaxID=3364061 RepID=UPI0037C5ED98
MPSAVHGLSRRAALLLVAGSLTGLSLPRVPPQASGAGPAAPAAADPTGRLLAAHAAALRAGPLAGLPLAEFGYRETARDASTLRVELAYRFQGFDDYPALLQRRFALTADGGLGPESPAPQGPAAPWDAGPVRLAHGRLCLVLGAEQAELTELAGVADRAVPAVSGVWGTDWAGRLVLQLPATEDQFAQLLAVSPDAYQDMAAVTSAAAGAPVHTPADRIMVNPAVYRELSAVGKQVVTTHEATHVATRADTHPWTPLWLSEGVADYTGYLATGRTARQIAPELAADVAAGRIPSVLPVDADFRAGSTGIAQAYEQGWLACDLIARGYGQPKLVAFYRAVGAAGPDVDLDRVFQQQLGCTLAAFTRQWIAETVRQLG